MTSEVFCLERDHGGNLFMLLMAALIAALLTAGLLLYGFKDRGFSDERAVLVWRSMEVSNLE